LPAWFVEDEKKHNVAQLPVTKAEVEYFKEQLQAINTRPMKKLAEARARKREKTVKVWESLKNKAQAIVDNPDVSASEKLRSVQKLYAGKKGIKEKKDKHYVVTAKGGRTFSSGKRKAGTRVKLVDSRMKKEIRSANGKKNRKGGKGGKGRKGK
jgi:AdoMet-dependent rRNA methyltransferase SPB1